MLFCLAGVSASVSPPLAEPLARSFERGHANLAVVLDDVNGFSLTIGEGRDLLGSFGPAHQVGLALKGLNKDGSLVGGRVKLVGKCLVVECFAPVIVDQLTDLSLSSNQLGH
jgi:hypothetical protein